MKNRKGYTLVEIAIVMMILALLSIISKGFYDSSVEKSRFAEAYTVVGDIINAQKEFHVLNDKFAENFGDLTLDIDGVKETAVTNEKPKNKTVQTRDFKYSIDNATKIFTDIKIQRIRKIGNIDAMLRITYVDEDQAGERQANSFYITKENEITHNNVSSSDVALKEMIKLVDFFVTK
ncbi:MAG: prepilin-type N-terminal cleavage/methylation domain-containing protein [Elusimicrobia bacterium]|nr:prepilin-type N-terminal cleavage/methylation domain-containing protein [Elusimicrobiota bacterium]